MPIFVQWKWQDSSKTFLVIFHFIDDFSKSNLRFKQNEVYKIRPKFWAVFGAENEDYPDLGQKYDFMTWAPSHIEVGLLSELLSYANRMNGLRENYREELRFKLEVFVNKKDFFLGHVRYESGFGIERVDLDGLRDRIPNRAVILGVDVSKDLDCFLCAELCPEYIEYLKEVIKPYL